MVNGKVKFFNDGKGYGFVTSDDDGKDYFVHVSGLAQGNSLKEGESVSFDVEQGERGPKAVNVQIGAAAPSEAPADEPAAEEPAAEEEASEEAEDEEPTA